MSETRALPRTRPGVAAVMAAALVFCCGWLMGEDADLRETAATPQFEDEITVSAPPILETSEVDENATVVATVTAQQVDDLNAQDPASALRRVPGVVISRYNVIGAYGGGDGGAIFIRGHGSGRPGADISTLVDGIPRFVGVWTHPLLDPLSLDVVARLDVYRSPQPVLLGNMAFGAVDMISKRRLEEGSEGRVVASVGRFQTLVGRLEHAGRSGDLDWFLTASRRTSDGHRESSDGEVDGLSGRIGYRLGEGWDLSAQLHHTASSVDDPGVAGEAQPPITQNYETDSDFVLATLAHHHGSGHGHLKLYLDDGRADWTQWDGVGGEQLSSISDTRNWGVRLRETFAPWSGGELVVGIDHDLYGGTFVEKRPSGDGPVTDLRLRNTAPYLMLSHTFGERVRVTPSAGVRHNDSRHFGSQWGGQAGLRVGLGSADLYANWARAFNLPGMWAAVMYGGWNGGDAWQDLKAETIDHLEAGAICRLGDRVSLEVSLFRDRVDNGLVFIPPPPPPPQFANIGSYRVNGLEVGVHAAPTERLRLFLGGTLSDPEPEDVPNLPGYAVTAGVSWAAGSWRANLDLEWVDERTVLNPRFASGQTAVEGHLLLNGRVGVPLERLGLPVGGEVFAAAENLTDEAYEYRPGYPMPGASWTLGVDLRF